MKATLSIEVGDNSVLSSALLDVAMLITGDVCLDTIRARDVLLLVIDAFFDVYGSDEENSIEIPNYRIIKETDNG